MRDWQDDCPDDEDFGEDDAMPEPVGSCDWCDINLYPGDDYDGLCEQCAWLSEQSARDNEAE